MDPEDHALSLIRQEIVKYHLQVTAIIQVNFLFTIQKQMYIINIITHHCQI